jgi:hypothetical protein
MPKSIILIFIHDSFLHIFVVGNTQIIIWDFFWIFCEKHTEFSLNKKKITERKSAYLQRKKMLTYEKSPTAGKLKLRPKWKNKNKNEDVNENRNENPEINITWRWQNQYVRLQVLKIKIVCLKFVYWKGLCLVTAPLLWSWWLIILMMRIYFEGYVYYVLSIYSNRWRQCESQAGTWLCNNMNFH